MADAVRPSDAWARETTPATTLLHHQEADWEYRELRYAPGGTWDVVTTRLHIAAHPDPVRQRLGASRNPFRLAAPSAAVSAPGDHLAGAWEGSGRGQHVIVSAGFVAAAFERDMGAEAVRRRHFALDRDPDATDAIVQHLMDCISVNLREGDPGGSIFMQSVVLALIHHALRLPPPAAEPSASRGGLSRVQLGTVIDLIDDRLRGRPGLVDLAAAIDVSTRYFCRAFRQSTGLSPHQFIIRRRVGAARALIEAGDLALSDVAHVTGFKGQSQMSASFRKVLGVPPSYFRNTRPASR